MRKTFAAIVLITLPSLAAGDVVVAALGDSLTQGYGLVPEAGFVPQLAGWLKGQGIDAKLINAGVSGDTTAGGLSRVAWTLTPDVDAVIVALGGNDLLRGIDPAVSRANLEGILRAAQEADVEILLVGMEAPGNYGPDYKQQFDDMYPELAREFGTFYAPSFFSGIDMGGEGLVAAARFMQPDGIHPNAEGVARIVDDLGPLVRDMIAAAQE